MKHNIYFIVFTLLVVCVLSLNTFDGTSNNILFYNWGSTNLEFVYVDHDFYPEAHQNLKNASIELKYKDKEDFPDSGPRGNARKISNTLGIRYIDNSENHSHSNMLFVMFSQFILNDIEFIKEKSNNLDQFELSTIIESVNDPSCFITDKRNTSLIFRCNDNDPVLIVPQSMPISHNNQHNYVNFRAINQATSFLDLDSVYGRSYEINRKLRTGSGGKLLNTNHGLPISNTTLTNYTNIAFNNLLPTFDIFQDEFDQNTLEYKQLKSYFVSGDPRVNQNIGMILFNTLFMREHNRLCDEIMNNNYIYRLFPRLFDDSIFEKARSINIAQFQKVVYEEYIPHLLGSAYKNMPVYMGYNLFINPTVNIEFSSTVMKFSNFMMKKFPVLNEDGTIFNPNVTNRLEKNLIYIQDKNTISQDITPLSLIYDSGGLENILRGMINTKSYPNEIYMSDDIRNIITDYGVIDVLTRDILKNRQMSVTTYTKLVKTWTGIDLESECNVFRSYDDIDSDPIECFELISEKYAEDLKELYKKIEHVDSIIGLQLEKKVNGTMFGNTSITILMDQFRRIRDGDRLFYLNDSSLQKEVTNSNMKRILERNFKVILKDNDIFNPW